MSTDPKGDLESALCEIEGIADCLHHLATAPGVADKELANSLAFLANRLHANHDAADDAMCRIFDEYGEQRKGGAT